MNKTIKTLLIFMLMAVVLFDISAITYLQAKKEPTAVTTEMQTELQTVKPSEPTTESATEPTTEPTTAKNVSLGVFKLTAYCPCKKCSGKWERNTATGATATAGRTIAVDPSVIPYGTEVIINGHTYRAEDCGGAVKENTIDIFFDTHEEAQQFGRQYVEVFLVN